MELVVEQSSLDGEVDIPASKSHTIRAVIIASLARGRSRIINPLDSADTRSALRACRAFGAKVFEERDWLIEGTAGTPGVPIDVIDVGNSGTTLRLGMGIAALCEGFTVFTGDEQIRRRPVQPLLDAYRLLGAEGFTTRGNGCAPLVIRGRIEGGRSEIKAFTSQYLSSLLIATPLAAKNSEIRVVELNEIPYVEMTLAWLNKQNIQYEQKGWKRFYIKGEQSYRCFEQRMPGDFSSATFFLCAAAVTHSELFLRGLDMEDVQGDRAVVEMLRAMGVRVTVSGGGLTVQGGDVRGIELDLNNTPDALPALAVTACFASGETRLYNVKQARLKETDRITVMASELRKLGARVRETEDGLVVKGAPLHGARVSGHRDHRVVMALALAGLAASGRTVVETAEAMNVTFPNFVELMRGCGARMELLREA
jgi:3-phosphoshikimate 1-carboxyvinyltransferase